MQIGFKSLPCVMLMFADIMGMSVCVPHPHIHMLQEHSQSDGHYTLGTVDHEGSDLMMALVSS